MPSDSGSGWSPPASNSERRLSNSSDGSACSGYSKATSDSADFLATRPHTAAVIPGKPAANPLQFIKVGPADLGSRAREQLRRAELAKKTDTSKIERQEDWQSNLDNWKSSRRKRVEHIIERCVEVRRLETEPRTRAKSKTFNEMLEERAGRRKKNHLALYMDDDSHDLSDLGIGTSSTKSSLSEDCDTQSLASDGMDLDKNHSDVDNMSHFDNNRKLGSSANEYDTCTTTTISSPEPEEYTYEGAIEGYKSRIISQTNSTIVKTVVNDNHKEKSPDKHNGDLNRIRTSVSHKIEQKVSSFQQERNNDIKNNNLKKNLPKVDIHKRREQFERENSQESPTTKPKISEISNKTSIKDRLSSFQKHSEEKQVQKSINDLTKLPTEVTSLQERLTSLEKIKTGATDMEKNKRQLNGDLSNAKSLKERLSSLKSQTSQEEIKINKVQVTKTLQERLSDLDNDKNKEVPKISIQEQFARNDKTELKLNDEIKDNYSDISMKSSLAGLENQMQSFCRSLDSLDINGQSSPSSFDRVQSLEDFDCADMQNNTVPSDIETEDSGIHTARDSCAPADDIADLTQVASPIGEPMVEISEYESLNEDCLITLDHPIKVEEPIEKPKEPIRAIPEDIIIEEVDENDPKSEQTDSESNYLEAVSQPEEFSATDEVTEIQMDKDDEDTLKSLENQDTSVSLNEPVSNSSDGDTVVFQGKMTIHLNLNEICNSMSAGAGSNSNTFDCSFSNSTNSKSMPMVIDALELAFQELDSEDSINKSNMDDTDKVETKPEVESIEAKTTVENKPPPLYENIDLFAQNSLDDVGAFPLDLPTTVMEPPKEKPPPPPVEDAPEDDLLGNGTNFKHTSSTRRIKKEIRNKRSSFLGIEGQVDDSYLDVDLKLAPRPDITSFLQEESKIEKLLYKKTLSHDMDTKLRDSRDSGVDIDRGPSAEAWYKGQSSTENSNAHSRQNSEPYAHVTVTSDEEESSKKNQQFTTNLTTKLSDLTNLSDESKIDSLDKKLEHTQRGEWRLGDWIDPSTDDTHTKEVLRFERELLQLEQEELRRQRDNLIRDQTRIIQKSVQDLNNVAAAPEKPIRKTQNQNYRHSMPNLLLNESMTTPPQSIISPIEDQEDKRKPFVSEEHIQRHFGVEESRKVLYDDRVKISEAIRKPVNVTRSHQPILPPKPKSRESIEREITMRSSRVPSAEQADEPPVQVQLRHKPNGNYSQMTRHTLQALSAAPTPKLLSNNEWQRRRPPTYNYNHWLIQEAEQRRIDEQRAKMRVQQRHSYHQDVTPNLNSMMPLSASQQLLMTPQEYKRPVHLRTDVPLLRNDMTREPPIRPEITPRPDLPIRPEVAKRPELTQRPEVLQKPELTQRPELALSRPEISQKPEVIQRLDNGYRTEIAPRPELRPDLAKRPEVPIRTDSQITEKEEKVLSVSGKRKCSHCGEELGRGAAMIIESLSLCYHVWCFRCGVCGAALGDGRAGADVRVRGNILHCSCCYSADDGSKYSRV